LYYRCSQEPAVINQLQSIKHFGLARLLLLLLLAQHAVVSVAMSGASDMHAANAITADMAEHGCGGNNEVAMGHPDGGSMQHDHQQCADSGCADCVGSVAVAIVCSVAIVAPAHAAENWQWSARMPVTAQPEILYRPPIEN